MKFSPLLLVAVSTVMLSGCATQTTTEDAPKAKRDGPREITSAPIGSRIKRKSDALPTKKVSNDEFEMMKAEQQALETAAQQKGP
jgi:uncharacterized lipoprotein YajG